MKSLTSALALPVLTLSLGSALAASLPGVEHNTAKDERRLSRVAASRPDP